MEAGFGDDVNLDGGVATGVVDVASVDLGDTHVGCVFLSFGECCQLANLGSLQVFYCNSLGGIHKGRFSRQWYVGEPRS